MGIGEVAEPVPGRGQVLVAPLACGICGSDLHLVESQAAMPDLLPAIVLGHEFVGELLDYGPGAERTIPLGTPVTSVPYLDAGDGPQLVGLSPAVTGGLAERLVLQERRLLPVAGDVPLRYAAFTEPLAVGVHAVAAADLQPGDTVLVVGCGPVGLSVIACLKAAGVGPVVAADFSPSRRVLAEQIGADVVVDPAASSPYQSWTELAGVPVPVSPLMDSPQQANTVVFECVGVPGILATVMDSAPPHTRIVVVGVCMQPDTITPVVGITKELSIRFVFAYRPDEFAKALDWIVSGTVDVAPFVTATLPLDAATEAFDELRQPDKHCKILLLPT
ncbi:zinc-binding dehydrogenase [Mycolicibacterium boenickei]|uniref:zinc-binding dehydrogenase n=1 Tax=Mycolicibacterium boenickei TaxID=146017 RepID=UPI002ADDDB2B|nr:zinc-binding dehydrogenase [Mycolicibacterium boenickei]